MPSVCLARRGGQNRIARGWFLYSNAVGVMMIALVAVLMIFFVRRGSRYIDAIVADMKADDTAAAAT